MTTNTSRELQKDLVACQEQGLETMNRYQALVRILGEIVYEHDVALDRIEWSGAYEQILGYGPVEMGADGPSWLSRVHPDDLPMVEAEFARAQREDQVYDLQYRFRHRDGRYLWFHDRGLMSLGPDGEVVTVLGVMKNIDLIRGLEQERHRLFELSLDMLCIAGFDGYFRQLNPAWERTLGWSQAELMAKPWVEFVHPDDVQSTLDAGNRLAADQPIISFENRYLCKDGSWRWLSWNSYPEQSLGLIYAVARDVTERKSMEAELKRLATTDSLTGVYNRQQFAELARAEFTRSRRYDHPLAMLMLDLDHFKRINDDYGHQAGDEVLKAMAKACSETLRDSDSMGRLGGEEFAVLLPETGAPEALQVAERLRQGLAGLVVRVLEGTEASFTVSIGVALATANDDDWEQVLRRADNALYEAKDAGRDRVEASPEAAPA